MAQSSEFTLRLEILREAYDQYKANECAAHTTSIERLMYALKAMECEAMMKELTNNSEGATHAY